MENISTQELDSIARLGMDDLRACFSMVPLEGAATRAEMALKVLGHSNRRMSAETNRLSLGFRVARILGVPAEELQPLWKQLSGASGEVASKSQGALAGLESTGSKAKRQRKG